MLPLSMPTMSSKRRKIGVVKRDRVMPPRIHQTGLNHKIRGVGQIKKEGMVTRKISYNSLFENKISGGHAVYV